MQVKSAFHTLKPIWSLNALARALGLEIDYLRDLTSRASQLYRIAQEIQKPDGSKRITYDALPELKRVHRQLKKIFFEHVFFPPYLTGSIKGQDYKANAQLHARAKIVINQDIASFFPATKFQIVRSIWKGFFGFGAEVADCLAKLTTLNGELPQGAITSPFLANLAFWQLEPSLEAAFRERGLTYSRFVDDMAVSSKTFVTKEDFTPIISEVYAMMFKCGYQPKRTKHEIRTSGSRMAVTKLSTNDKPGLERTTRSRIRAMVHRLENSPNEFALRNFSKVLGQVSHLKRFHPGEAGALKDRLNVVRNRLDSTLVTGADQVPMHPTSDVVPW